MDGIRGVIGAADGGIVVLVLQEGWEAQMAVGRVERLVLYLQTQNLDRQVVESLVFVVANVVFVDGHAVD